MIRSPARGCCFAEALEIAKRDLVGRRGHVGQHVGGAVRLQQRHLAERHARGQRRQPDAVGQGDVHHAAAQKEQRSGGIAGGDDLLAGL